jgi:very-short-patch-repair endonuclease
MDAKSASPSNRVDAIAAAQHGVVTRAQLREAGLGDKGIAGWTRRGRLHRVHQGVYAVGYPASNREARWMAAVLACGDGAVLSHMSAAVLWGLLKPEDGPVDVSLPSQSGRRRREGIRIHRCASLAEGERAPLLGISEQRRLTPSLVTVRHGIPVTSVPRTMDDLRRGKYPAHWVRRAARQAELAGHRLDDGPPRRTRSDLEDDFLVFLRRHRLSLPEVNVKVGRWEVDFLWRAQRLAVETDFYDYHRGPTSFEDDHQRDLDLRRMGFSVHRYTGAQLRGYPAEIAAELGEILKVEDPSRLSRPGRSAGSGPR